MIERLIMVGLDRRALRARGSAVPDAGAIADAVRSAIGRDARAGVVVLSTCERFEIYAGAAPGAEGRLLEAILAWHGADDFVILRGFPAARHLLRVAAGLDSRLVGETHVLGQVRRAADEARSTATIGPDLSRVFSRALRCGKRVRSETTLGRAGATYASLAAAMVLDRFAGACAPRVGIIGTGAVALEVGEFLAGGGADVVILGRHPKRTESLARHLGAAAAHLDALAAVVPKLDALITATGAPRPIVHASDLAGASPTFTLIDLGMPPNAAADARTLGAIVYRGLDDVAPDHLPPQGVIGEAEAIVERELAALSDDRRPAGAVAPLTGVQTGMRT